MNVRKDSSGVWKSKGQTITRFSSDWADNEPTDAPGADCAYISASAGYKMKAENCLTPKKFFCMALKPNCPDGYTWIPAFGKGLSCFRQTPLVGEFAHSNPTSKISTSINIGDKMCLKDGVRLAVPQSIEETTTLHSHYDLQSTGTSAALGIIQLTPAGSNGLEDKFIAASR